MLRDHLVKKNGQWNSKLTSQKCQICSFTKFVKPISKFTSQNCHNFTKFVSLWASFGRKWQHKQSYVRTNWQMIATSFVQGAFFRTTLHHSSDKNDLYSKRCAKLLHKILVHFVTMLFLSIVPTKKHWAASLKRFSSVTKTVTMIQWTRNRPICLLCDNAHNLAHFSGPDWQCAIMSWFSKLLIYVSCA